MNSTKDILELNSKVLINPILAVVLILVTMDAALSEIGEAVLKD